MKIPPETRKSHLLLSTIAVLAALTLIAVASQQRSAVPHNAKWYEVQLVFDRASGLSLPSEQEIVQAKQSGDPINLLAIFNDIAFAYITKAILLEEKNGEGNFQKGAWYWHLKGNILQESLKDKGMACFDYTEALYWDPGNALYEKERKMVCGE